MYADLSRKKKMKSKSHEVCVKKKLESLSLFKEFVEKELVSYEFRSRRDSRELAYRSRLDSAESRAGREPMIFGVTGRDLARHYGCFLEKGESEHKIRPLLWWLRGKEVVMQGGDAFDEVHDLAVGDCPEELIMWAELNSLDMAEDVETRA